MEKAYQLALLAIKCKYENSAQHTSDIIIVSVENEFWLKLSVVPTEVDEVFNRLLIQFLRPKSQKKQLAMQTIP